MTKHYIILLIVRLLLPSSMLISIVLRPFGLSVIYLLLYLLAPITNVPDERTIKGYRGKFLLLIGVISTCLFAVHLVWHSVLAAFPPYGKLLEDYELLARIGHNLGLVSYERIDPLVAVHYLAPELIMMSVSWLVYFSTSKLLSSGKLKDGGKRDPRFQQYPLLTTAGKYLSLFLIMFSGIMRPSATSGIYFLVFMGSATAWACGKPLEKGFAVVARCVMAIMACHVCGLLAYQCQWLIDLYGPTEPFARYFGLTQLVSIEDSEPNSFSYVNLDTNWTAFASPLTILITYFVLAIESRELFKPKAAFDYISSKAPRGSESETTPLIRAVSPQKKRILRRPSSGRSALKQDSTGSVIIPDDESTADQDPTLVDEIATAIIGFFQVLVRSSYIATTITMMTWSIMFHSWLAFVFLMWGNIVWLCPDQRSFMLKTSPLLVIYAMLLLTAEYLYGIDLTEDELPSNIVDVNLHQIGLGRSDGEPFIPLLIKSLFTCMFWVTLRQRVQEIRQRRQSAVVADMAAPLQLTVSTAASAMEAQREEETQSRLLKAFGDWLRSMCAVYWIYVVVIMLFVIGITGERMTIFRIIYMFLFLTFILMFQISWTLWRKFMYLFWIIVIVYSMLNLILVYVYQFDNFSKTIEQYLFINERLQRSLGLEPYLPADLFLKLLTPTLFLIITIMQVHYFHKDFMKYSDPKTRSGSVPRDPASSRPSQGASTMKDDLPALPLEDEGRTSPGAASGVTDMDMYSTNLDKSRMSHLDQKRASRHTVSEPQSRAFKDFAAEMFAKTRVFVFQAVDKIFIYLDLHLMKIIFVSLMLLSVMDVCAMHVPIMVMISPGLLMSTRRQRFFILVISILISAYFMAKMVYQIDYIEHPIFDVNCTKETDNGTITTTYNNAKWVGFVKTTAASPLVAKLKGYIALIALFTFHSLVTYRQQVVKGQRPLLEVRDKVMFPEVDRPQADLDAVHCIKYLFNYCFYKFGVEITLICLVGVIGSRMDVYAMFYAFWLLVLISVARVTQARVWPAFTAFITFVIPMQYIIAVGFVPQFCVDYPWDGDSMQMKHTRTWLFLPHMDAPPHATKLIFDFFLLLFAARQLKVFRIEKLHGDNYPGGSNSEDIGKDWETPNFVNPVPDFLGLVESWLDMIKRMVFLGMLWVSLAIMFLTGTNRVNLFSMGYLIGSFIFLWQGTDFYLRPKHIILLWWSWLLRYNVCVVAIKTLLQIPGCIFSHVLQENACWMVQLLGIGCVDKFAGGNINRFFQMQYTKTSTCNVPQEDIGLAWDGVCFAFLILQRRLFHSYYFYRVIDESKATTVLASRGAELIEELRQKQMFAQEEQEVKILEKIKVKMERIKANQKKVQGALVKEASHHDRGSGFDPDRGFTPRHRAIRSGDYYMFDEFDDTDVQLEEEQSSEDEEEPKEMGLGKARREQPPPILKEKEPPEPQEADEPLSDLDDTFQPLAETLFEKIKRLLETAWAFISSLLWSLTRHFMKYSRDYRYVSRTLSIEKKILKDQEGFGMGLRKGSRMIWEPLPENSTYVHSTKDITMLEDQDDSIFRQNRSPLLHLAYALWFAVIAHTDIVCFIMVFVNQIQSATILSLPLPLMVFLWGTLTIPRPTKTFWVTLIAYTEVIVIIKSMFQFEILPWNQKAITANQPFAAPRIIGIERKGDYALYDLLLLLIIFLHRFMLKSLGLWNESSPEPEIPEEQQFELSPEDAQLVTQGRADELGHKYLVLSETPRSPRNAANQPVEGHEGDGTSQAEEEGQPGPSKPTDDHYNVNDEQEPIIAVTTNLEETYNNYPQVLALSVKRYLRPVRYFFQRVLEPGARVTADVYAYMFLCDFFNFLVVIFGFAAFGTHQGDGGVQTYLEENKVPIPFLVMLILQFGLIVIDRALYLRKFILGKILFQYALICGVHVWMFFVLPAVTERTFNALIPPPMWYMVKCIYLLLSAYQIRCGYPRRIIGNFLCKSYRYLNQSLFRGFMAVPFVFELRTLMDWIWTDTSMTLMDWLKMEDIFANVFLLKCSRHMEDEYPHPRGEKQTNTNKYILGGGVLAFMIAIIWFPLVFFAFGNTVGEPNPPSDVTVKIRIGPFLPVYQMSAQAHNIDLYTELEYAQLSNMYARDRTVQTFLSNYMYNDVAVITLNPTSTMDWVISPPELDRLEKEAASNSTLMIKLSFIITHPTNSAQNPPTIEDSQEVSLEAYVNGKRNPERDKLMWLLAGNATEDTWLNVHELFPKFLKVFNKGTAKPAYQLMPETESGSRMYRNVKLRLERDKDAMYWRVHEACEPHDPLAAIPLNNCDMLVMYTFNDKLFPETLNFISGSGIIGLYTTFVFLASRVLRGFFSGIYTKIMFDDLPNVDRVLQLCLDIYLVREALELCLEEDLFAKLVFLYRSPETMIKWSRPKEEENAPQRALVPSR